MRRVLAAAALAAFAFSAGAAEDWPERPVRLIIPFLPGGSNDIVGRVIGAKLTDRIGKPVVLDNRGGAGGMVGTETAIHSRADGYTLLLISVAHAYTASMRKVPFDPLQSITPVALIGAGTNSLVVHPSVPARSVKELIALAKARPGQLNYASAGAGSFTHLSGELFRTMAGIDVVHVPYKGGSPTMIAMISGQAQYFIGALLQTLQYFPSGKLRALGVGSLKRNPVLPDVPTIAESGLPGYEASNWWGIVGPAGLPPAIVKRLNSEVSAILAAPDTRKWFEVQGAEAVEMTPQQFHQWIATEIRKWSRVVKDAGLRDE